MVKIGDRVTINRQKFREMGNDINGLNKYEWLEIFRVPGVIISIKDKDAFVDTELGKWYFPLYLLRVTNKDIIQVPDKIRIW